MQLDLSAPAQQVPSVLALLSVTQSESTVAADKTGDKPPTTATAISKATNLRNIIGVPNAYHAACRH